MRPFAKLQSGGRELRKFTGNQSLPKQANSTIMSEPGTSPFRSQEVFVGVCVETTHYSFLRCQLEFHVGVALCACHRNWMNVGSTKALKHLRVRSEVP